MSKGRRTVDPVTGKQEWYVYALYDPRIDEPFYVGKGKGRRAYQHEKEVRRGKVVNQAKHDRIKEIISLGMSVDVRILAMFDKEDDAYACERKEIERIGKTVELLNMNPGGFGGPSVPWEISDARRGLAKAELALSQIIPFDQWMRMKNTEDWMIPVYAEVIANLTELAGCCRAVISEWEAA